MVKNPTRTDPSDRANPRPRIRSGRRRAARARRRGLVVLGLAAIACATPPSQQAAAPAGPASDPNAVPDTLTEDGRTYLRNIFQVECADGYLVYPEGEGPPVPERTALERQEREAELRDCLREKVLARYTTLEMVQAMTWDGESYVMSPGEMTAIVRYGDDFLAGYVERLLEGERQREGTASDVEVPPEDGGEEEPAE